MLQLGVLLSLLLLLLLPAAGHHLDAEGHLGTHDRQGTAR
jgi:hypothetical protein